LTDEQWALIEKHFPKPRPGQHGRPQRNTRELMDGVLWMVRAGAPWQDLPERFPPYQTCHRRIQSWLRTGVLEKVLKALGRHPRQRGRFDLTERLIDGSFVGAKKGAPPLAPPSGEKVRSSWHWQTALALQSPYTLTLQARIRSSSSRPRWKRVSRKSGPSRALDRTSSLRHRLVG